MAQEITGDLLLHDAEYICHQCNCVTKRAAHLSQSVFTKFPYANIYADRKYGQHDEPGTVIVCGDENNRYVANMLAQYSPGKSKSAYDSYEKRLNWFSDCLEALETLNGRSYAFPYRIGCGAAGGDWTKYKEKIDAFARRIDGDVFIVKLP